MEKNMTALISLLARAYHFKNNKEWIFKDDMAHMLLREEEYISISSHMSSGIKFFNPDFKGDEKAAFKYIVNHHLSPSVLARSAFCEKSLINAISFGCKQYVIFASGYDSFSLRRNFDGLNVFELDRPEIIADKKKRIAEAGLKSISNVSYISCDLAASDWVNQLKDSGFCAENISFSSLLGITYYLTEQELDALFDKISHLSKSGSSAVFDYPTYENDDISHKNRLMAKEANEEMKSKYSYAKMEKLLEKHGFLIYEYLNPNEMTDYYFSSYNSANKDDNITAPAAINYCLAVKQ